MSAGRIITQGDPANERTLKVQEWEAVVIYESTDTLITNDQLTRLKNIEDKIRLNQEWYKFCLATSHNNTNCNVKSLELPSDLFFEANIDLMTMND
jgi:hypothetical protein